MSWQNQKAEAMAIAMNEFGEAIVFDPDGAAMPAVGIYHLAADVADVGGVAVQAPAPLLEVSAETVADAGVSEGMEVSLRGQRLTVIGIERNAGPSVSLQLRGYA